MELSAAHNPVHRVMPSTCRFALHPIVSVGANADEEAGLVWNEALVRPGVGFEHTSPSDLVEFLYANESLETDISILKRLTGWLARQRTPQRLSINIHPDSLTRRPFMVAALEGLQSVMHGGHSICLELVEFGHCGDRASMVQNANRLRRHGALIALDDFGSRLNFFDMCAEGIVDILKVDVSVTDGIDRCTNKQAIVRGINTLAEGLGAKVVVEGIETQAQLSKLKEIGISFGQGYLFKRPIIEESI